MIPVCSPPPSGFMVWVCEVVDSSQRALRTRCPPPGTVLLLWRHPHNNGSASRCWSASAKKGYLLPAVCSIVAGGAPGGGCFFAIVPRHNKHGVMRAYVVRILFMVPIYAMAAWLGLIQGHFSLWWNLVREVYEAFTIHSFIRCAECRTTNLQEGFMCVVGVGWNLRAWFKLLNSKKKISISSLFLIVI